MFLIQNKPFWTSSVKRSSAICFCSLSHNHIMRRSGIIPLRRIVCQRFLHNISPLLSVKHEMFPLIEGARKSLR